MDSIYAFTHVYNYTRAHEDKHMPMYAHTHAARHMHLHSAVHTHTHNCTHTVRCMQTCAHICRSATLSLPSTVAHANSFSVAYLHNQGVLTTLRPIDTTTTYSSTYPDTMLIAEKRLQLLSNYKSSCSRKSISVPSYVLWY